MLDRVNYSWAKARKVTVYRNIVDAGLKQASPISMGTWIYNNYHLCLEVLEMLI